MDTIVERMFHTEEESERGDWIKHIETVRNGLEEIVEQLETEDYDENKVTRFHLGFLILESQIC